MSLVELFDKIANHLLTQNKRCVSKFNKPVGHSRGLSDPLGFILGKKKYNRSYNELGINTEGIQLETGFSDEEISVIEDLQSIHDIIIPEKWPEWISMFRESRFKEVDVDVKEDVCETET